MEKKKTKIIVFLLSTIAMILFAWYFFNVANNQATYEGLPTVPCIDPAQKTTQDFTFTITIYIKNKKYSLEPSIGHDFGNCLHALFTNDSSGTVYVRSNTTEPLTLGQFFDTWKKTFNKNQIFQYQTGNTHQIKVFIDDKSVDTFDQTILQPNQIIVIIYN